MNGTGNGKPLDYYVGGTIGYEPAASQQRPAPEEQSLAELLLFLSRHWRTVAATIVASVIVGALYCLFAKPKYTAVATLEFRDSPSALPRARSDNETWDAAKEEKHLQTQVAKLSRLNVANYVLSSRGLGKRLEALKIADDGWIGKAVDGVLSFIRPRAAGGTEGGPYDYSERFLREYLRLIRTEPVFATSLVEVAATTTDPLLSRDIANGQVEGFIEFDRGERHDQLIESLAFLQSQADDLREKVAASERALAQYAQEKELLTLSNQESVVVREIGDLTKLLSEATGKRIQSESMLRGVQNSPIEHSTILDDESIRMQRVQLKQAEAEYADLAERVTSAYPPMQQLMAKIKALRENIREQRQQALAALQSQHGSNLETEQKLRSQVEERKQAAFKDSRDLVRYNIMRREYDSLRDLYQSILRQLKEDQVSSASKGSNIGVADYAVTPEKPSSPNIPLVLAVSLAGGLLLGCGIVAVRNFFNHTLESPDEVSDQFRLPMLGVVPLFGPEDGARHRRIERRPGILRHLLPAPDSKGGVTEEAAGHEQFVTINLSAAGASEAFRAVRATILLSASENHPRVILVASPQQGEGKTTVVSNLAVTLAQAQHPTLLVDSDLRCGALSGRFRLPDSQPGLTDFLSGHADLNEVIADTGVKGLRVLPAGSQRANPSELVGSPRMRELIAELRRRYDYILLDSPPILPVADALTLSRIADGVVVVLRRALTDKRLAARAIERLRQVRARVLGIIVNGFDSRRNPEYGAYEKRREGYPAFDTSQPNEGRDGAF